MSGQAAVDLFLNFAGQNNEVVPRLGRLYAPNNTLAQVEAAGFLDAYLKANSNPLMVTDFVAVVASDGDAWLRPSVSNGSWTLNVFP